MVLRGLLAVLVLVASGLLGGCSDDDSPTPFEGEWVSATAGRLNFQDSRWWDGAGDSGNFSFWGDYPDFTVVFKGDGEQIERYAHFRDTHTFDLCSRDANGAPFDCNQFVTDKPTLH